jgi:hypothetical protein
VSGAISFLPPDGHSLSTDKSRTIRVAAAERFALGNIFTAYITGGSRKLKREIDERRCTP